MANKSTKQKDKTKAPIAKPASGDPPKCKTGYYWNGTACVKDVG